MVTTASASATALRALAAMVTPAAAAVVFAASTRSKPATEWPALTRLAAIGPPMLPRPRNAILAMTLPFGTEAPDRGLRRGRSRSSTLHGVRSLVDQAST